MLVVHGKKRLLTAPSGEIDCGNSATTMRLLAGVLAGQSFDSVLVGGATLSARPMDRVITPLRKMGAHIVAQGPNETAPIKIHGVKLRGANHVLPIASAQVKSALLLAGLFAKGKTTVREPFLSRNHTELMLNYFLIRTAKEEDEAISIFGDQVPESRDRKSTRLNSSHLVISYAVFCLKKKNRTHYVSDPCLQSSDGSLSRLACAATQCPPIHFCPVRRVTLTVSLFSRSHHCISRVWQC